MRITGYQVGEALCTNPAHVIYQGIRERDEQSVLIKVPQETPADLAAQARLAWEYEATRALSAEGVVPAYELVPYGPGTALILEDVGSRFLRHCLDEQHLDLDTSLSIALHLATTLATLHQHHIVHKAVNPHNILVNQDTEAVWLTGLHNASRLSGEEGQISRPDLQQGLLAYISPEQTGRMNRRVDYRSDFYALGVTLYEMLTGRLPFEATDPLELVHAHIARTPAAPGEVQPGVPEAVSNIVLKLLAKTAEDRYQSAQGLRFDLAACLQGKAETDFVPGAHDVSDRFQIPQKLYGRAHEVETLMSAFERISQGATELLLVSGYSGIGKSALVNEIHRPIVRQKGYFISGKFDQFQRNIPYSAVIGAFQELTQQLLTQSENQIAIWRSRLREALGQNGQVITNVIPEIELIIGPQPPVPALPPAETKNRLNLVFERFIRVFAHEEHPLVIFLDDLQWADEATLALIQALITDQTLYYLLILGAYRDNEVDATHPLTHTLSVMETAGAVTHTLTLQPLGPEDLTQFVADVLKQTPRAVQALVDLVRRKTNGNPFFVIQFLKSLYEEDLLIFDYTAYRWQYDLEPIENLDITENVVDLMVRKIERLPESTQNVVRLAACIGNSFDLATLSIVCQVPPERAIAELRDAVNAGLIQPGSKRSVQLAEFRKLSNITDPESATYRFLHDRVQQAAYALIPNDSKQVVHLQVGRLRWEHSDEAGLDEHLFEIVGHLNIGASLIIEAEERTRLAELNLRAGRKAKTSTAYKPALTFFETGIEQLPTDGWTAHYDLAFALHLKRAEAAYLCGHFERAEHELDHLLEQSVSPLQKAEIYRIRIVQYENTSRFAEARECGKTGLALFDIAFPDHEMERQVVLKEETETIHTLIGDRDIEALIQLPVMTDAAMRISMKLLMTMWAPSVILGDMMLTAMISAKMVRLSLTFGNVEASAYGYVTYGAYVGLSNGDYASSYAFGQLALAVNDRFDDLSARAKVHHIFSERISLWRKPIAAGFAHSREAYRAGLSSGDFNYATYAVFHESWHALFNGQPLKEYHDHYSTYLAFMTKTKNQTFFDTHQLMLHLSLALQGRTEGPCSLMSDAFDEASYLQKYRSIDLFGSFYYVVKLQLLYHCGKYEEAHRIAQKAEALAYATEGMIWDAWRCFYQALTLSALFSSFDAEDRKTARVALDELCSRLQTWAQNCPENFSHHHRLVFAEIAALRGEIAEAMTAYEQAIGEAAQHGFIQIEALANECYARFWLKRGNESVGGLYVQAAGRCYGQWGASARVEDLNMRYPHLLAVPSQDARAARPLDTLDLTTVIRAAQVISGEVEQRRVLDRLLRIVMENAGAQRGCLLLEREGELLIEAEGTATEEEWTVGQATPVASSRSVALSIVYYVARVVESVVLADATGDDRFSKDPYILERKPLSVLCTPILHQGKSIGMLYLENNLVRDAFTPGQIEVVGILASQAAISLENARLYEEMRQEVAERKRAEKELQRTYDHLELRVEERTDELSLANARLQEEIGVRQKIEIELLRAKEAAEAANRAKSEFLANMSHELRTPLNGILGYTQILRRDERLTDAQRNGIAVIERSGEHLLTLINDILDLAKIEAGKLEVHPVEFHLPEFLQNIADIARVRAEQKGLAFLYESFSRLPGVVRGDEQRLRQVLLNLLSNAVKFTEQGGVALRVGYSGSASEQADLRFEIADTGLGIAPVEQVAIFEPFHQIHGPDWRAEGTGLGLAISQKLARLMGGELHVESTPGEGSTFWVELALPEIASRLPVMQSNRRITGFEGPPPRILVVDDKAENRAVLVDLLHPLGFELEVAENGQAALAKATAFSPHVVLMDLVMPMMDGFEAARQLRRMPGLGEVVIIALSASVFEHSRQQSREAGCDDFIPKPVQAGLLFNKLQAYLELQWIYAEKLDEGTTTNELAPAVLVAPDAEQAMILHDLAMSGDVHGIRHQLDVIEGEDEAYGLFVAEVRRMADAYDMQRISDYVKRYCIEHL